MYLKRLSRRLSVLCLILIPGLGSTSAQAEDVHVAVAANFTAAMKEIAADFEKASGHHAVLSFGSTGKLYAQISHGAPFEVFLAADQRRPELLEKEGLAGGRFTYAIGKLVLWSSDAKRQVGEQALRSGDFQKVAIANPKTAPYGAAAVEVMRNLGLYQQLKPKLVLGDSIAQTHQFVATGNAQMGFVALAQIALDGAGSRWPVPDKLYTPIRQDAVLLDKGKHNPAAPALMAYLKSQAARAVIHKYGYGTE
jgi:molybdate transport system substrate-binding protein